MPRNGSGTFTLAVGPFTPGTVISSSDVNSDFSDIATALTNSLASDGQTELTGQLKASAGANPSYSFAGDTNTGFGSSGPDVAYAAAGGVQIIVCSATGAAVTGTFGVTGDFAVNTNKFVITATSGATVIAGLLTLAAGLTVSAGAVTFQAGSVSRLALANAPVSFTYLIAGTALTYNTPANCKVLRIRMVGGGAGGVSSTGVLGTNGNVTIWDTVTANGGTAVGAGGTGGGGAASLRIPGGAGQGVGTAANSPGGAGGNSAFGGGGRGQNNTAGGNGATNSGGGGAGGASAGGFGTGGGSGEYAELVITTPAASYTYTVAATAAGAVGGTVAGAGAAGLIIVEEHF